MSLTNSQYNAVMRLYDRRQTEDHRVLQQRREKAYREIPELAEIDRETADRAVARLRKSLLGEDTGDLKASSALSPEERKRQALKAHGFPEDFLDPVYVCSDCRDTGYIGRNKCHCFRKAVVDLFYTESGLKEVLKAENFSSFSLDYYPDDLIDPQSGLSSREAMKRVLKTCRDFSRGFDRLEKPFLLLLGESGRGKTFLSHCMAGELLESAHSVIYYSAKDLFDRLADVKFRRGKADPDENAFDPAALTEADLLIIDDLGTEYANDFTVSEFFSILNSRVSAGKGMIISTNLSLKNLSDSYSPRIMSRIMENFTLLHLFGKDIRIMKRMGGISEA